MNTSIEWCDSPDGAKGETWNPTLGCSRVSEGCRNCYAERVAHRAMSPAHRGLTVMRGGRPGWTGEVRLVPEALERPLRWKKPRRIFVNSMSDLFHERVPFDWIAAVFGVMAMASHHTYLVLTKRPARAVEFFAWIHEASRNFERHVRELRDANAGRVEPDPRVCLAVNAAERARVDAPDLASATRAYDRWPLANVQIGVSAEDQPTWDERVAALRKVPNALAWVSVEPQLGFIVDTRGDLSWLRWVVVGGESGPGARLFDIAWARSMLAQCKGARVPVFVKQLGARPVLEDEPCPSCRRHGVRARHGRLGPRTLSLLRRGKDAQPHRIRRSKGRRPERVARGPARARAAGGPPPKRRRNEPRTRRSDRDLSDGRARGARCREDARATRPAAASGRHREGECDRAAPRSDAVARQEPRDARGPRGPAGRAPALPPGQEARGGARWLRRSRSSRERASRSRRGATPTRLVWSLRSASIGRPSCCDASRSPSCSTWRPTTSTTSAVTTCSQPELARRAAEVPR